MKRILKTMFVLMCGLMMTTVTTTVMTSCSSYDTPVVVTDDKPFPYEQDIDNSVRPGDDFYRYVIGQWLNSSNPSPSIFKQVEEGFKVGFDNIMATTTAPLVVLLRSQADEALSDDSKNVALLKERLQMLEQVQTADQLYAAFDTLQSLGYCPLFRLTPIPEIGKKVAIAFATGGNTEEMAKVLYKKERNKLDSLVNVYCQPLSGLGFSKERIAEITNNAVNVETNQMNAYASTEMLIQQPEINRHRAQEADDNDKRIDEIIGMIGISHEDFTNKRVLFGNSKIKNALIAFSQAGDIVDSLKAYRDYMIYNVIAQDAPFVPSINKQATRQAMLRSALQYNRYYKYRVLVEGYGYENIYKQQCNDIMERMRAIFIQRVDNLDWMSEATKAEARHKAEAMKFYIGYPEQWNDAMTPEAQGDCLLATATQLRQDAVKKNINMGGANIDVITWDFWATYAQFTTDNAFYSPTSNSLVILPAWITKPRFNNELSEAMLYACAVTFGHEFCHGFDANGSEYDADGYLRDWWAPSDRTAFEAKQQIMIDLYNQLEAYPGQPANGKKTLEENMADYGGIELTMACYKQQLTKQGFKGKQFDEQIKKFFLGYAQSWKYERELSLEQLMHYYEIDNHSAAHNRVNGMMRLQDDWYRLYDIQPTDKLYLAPKDRVKIW